MNIMFLHENPVHAARFHCIRHVRKQLVEASQLMSTALHVLHEGGRDPREVFGGHPWYKPYNPSGRFVQWLVLHMDNRVWLYRMAEELFRMSPGDNKAWHLMKENCLYGEDPFTPSITTPAWAFDLGAHPENRDLAVMCTDVQSTVKAYREYYRRKNKQWTLAGRPMEWYSAPPKWIKEEDI